MTNLETYEARALALIYQESQQIQRQIKEHKEEIGKLAQRLETVNADLTEYTRKLSGDDTVDLNTHDVILDSDARTLKVKAKDK